MKPHADMRGALEPDDLLGARKVVVEGGDASRRNGHVQIFLSFSTDAEKKSFSKSHENAAMCGVTMHFGC